MLRSSFAYVLVAGSVFQIVQGDALRLPASVTAVDAWAFEAGTPSGIGATGNFPGSLVFNGGTNDRMFRAFDASTGDILWKMKTNSGIMAPPSSFEVDGVQYIAVQDMDDPPHEVNVSATVDKAVQSLAEHRRYLELLSDVSVDEQAKQVIDMSTMTEDGRRRVGFRLFWG